MFHDFIINHLSPDMKTLHISCYSCTQQNKNNTLFSSCIILYTSWNNRVFYCVMFIEREHSYMECDYNMMLIPKKQVAELPKDWYSIIRKSNNIISYCMWTENVHTLDKILQRGKQI